MAFELTAARQEMMKASYKLDGVQRRLGDLQKQVTGMQNQMNRIEILVQRLVNPQARVVEPRNMKDRAQSGKLEMVVTRKIEDLRQSNMDSTQGIQLMSTPEGNFNSPSTGFSVVATGWGEDPLPRSSLDSPTWNHQSPSLEPALVRQWPQNPKEYLSQPHSQYQVKQWNPNPSKEKVLSAPTVNADLSSFINMKLEQMEQTKVKANLCSVDYQPRRVPGKEILEQEVYGIDPYTHNPPKEIMPADLDWTMDDKHALIEEVVPNTLNWQVRHFTGSGNTPMVYLLKSVNEDTQKSVEESGDRRIAKMCFGLLKAMRSHPEYNYVAYRKGIGVVCSKKGEFGEDDLVAEFFGEVYPFWRWYEKKDGIKHIQNNSQDQALEFYNIMLEKPKGDCDGYDLVFVDAMRKANYASRICYSCNPNCEAKMTAVDQFTGFDIIFNSKSPDWRVGELESNFKDEFARSNNNKHENGVGVLNITSKKLKPGVPSEKSSQGVISGTNNSDSQKCNSEQIHSANGVVSQDINSTDKHIGDYKVESSAFLLSTEDTISETRYPADNWNSCQFALSNGSPVLNTQGVPQSGLSYGDNDLSYIDWPGIDNFEDVDTLFRRCDSTYGQQQLESTDELSWIPSSDAIYSSDVALQPGFQSSYSDYGILDDLSAFNCTQDKSLPTADPSAAVCDKQFNDDYPFDEPKNVNVYGEQVYQGDAMELLSTDQICHGHGSLDVIGNRYSSENAMQQLEDHNFSIASGSQLSSSQNLLKPKHQLDSTSPSNITSESYPERNCQFSPSGASFAQRNLKAGHPGHQKLTRRASYPCENYEIEKRALRKRSLGDRQVTMGTSMVVDGSFVSSVSSDNSVKESSFQQLQDAVSQLDVKTKLCIRDGLYRLARSAQNRQAFPNTINRNGDSQDVKDMQNAETSGKFVDPVHIETQTNPIDRSIALLLFHQPSDHVTRAVDDASSLKSHVSNDNHQALAKNQGVTPASIYSPRGQGGPMDAKSRGNY